MHPTFSTPWTSALALALFTATAVPAHAMGAGQNPLNAAPSGRAERSSAPVPVAVGAQFCKAIASAGTFQRAAGARGSCVVVPLASGVPSDAAGPLGTHTRTALRGGRSAAPTVAFAGQ